MSSGNCRPWTGRGLNTFPHKPHVNLLKQPFAVASASRITLRKRGLSWHPTTRLPFLRVPWTSSGQHGD